MFVYTLPVCTWLHPTLHLAATPFSVHLAPSFPPPGCNSPLGAPGLDLPFTWFQLPSLCTWLHRLHRLHLAATPPFSVDLAPSYPPPMCNSLPLCTWLHPTLHLAATPLLGAPDCNAPCPLCTWLCPPLQLVGTLPLHPTLHLAATPLPLWGTGSHDGQGLQGAHDGQGLVSHKGQREDLDSRVTVDT